MVSYYKTNKKVAEYLNLQDARNTAKDGNFLLWACDMERIGPDEYALPATGAIKLTPVEARMEYVGERCVPLNTPNDPRFIDGSEETEKPADDNAETSFDENVSESVEPKDGASAESDNKEEV